MRLFSEKNRSIFLDLQKMDFHFSHASNVTVDRFIQQAKVLIILSKDSSPAFVFVCSANTVADQLAVFLFVLIIVILLKQMKSGISLI
jgi:hypothetical protein